MHRVDRMGFRFRLLDGLFMVLAVACLAFSALGVVPTLEDNVVTAGRLTYTVGAGGLPSQIAIGALPWELPLEMRGEAAPPADRLRAIGRGPQLATPMRLEALVEGQPTVLEPAAPATPVEEDGAIVWRSELAGGGVTARLETRYGGDGSLSVSVAYRGGAVDSLALALDLDGPVDTVVSGEAPFGGIDFTLGEGEGLLWGNAARASATPAGSGPAPAQHRGEPGVPSHLFWGNGDRGFSWLCDAADGWVVTPVAPSMTIARDAEGVVRWRALLVNHPVGIGAEKQAAFTLLVHPALTPAAGQRRLKWLDWPHGDAAATPPLTAAGRTATPGLVRADRGTVYAATAVAALLAGPAGGDMPDAGTTLADAYPATLFRYLAGTHAGLPARLKSNVSQRVRPGMNPAFDRMALGRALLHDIGYDPAGAANVAMAARIATALDAFGYFADDGQTEYLPYWRSAGVVRYGEVHEAGGFFEEFETDPMERVHVSAWIRPMPEGEGRQAMILVVNESDRPMREQLYVIDPQRLFGGANEIMKTDMIDRWDFGAIPEDGDWSRGKLRGQGVRSTVPGEPPRGNVPFLLDLEDDGGLVQSVVSGGQEVYRRLFVPARGFRLLYGRGK